MKYAFESLEVWQQARRFVKTIYLATTNFPNDEKFGLTSQLRRASVSVSSNIAEGSTRWTQKEKARFYEIAYGSLMEVLNQTILSNDLNFLPDAAFKSLREDIDSISRMLNALYQSTQKLKG